MTLNDLKKKFEEDCYLQLGNLHAKIDLSQIIEITWNSALSEVLEKMPEEKQLGDGMYIDTDKKAFYDDGISEGFNQCLKEVIKIVEGMRK